MLLKSWIVVRQCREVHTASHLFKQWLRDLKDPLIPLEFHQRALNIGAMDNTDVIQESVDCLVRGMATHHRYHQLTLFFLVEQLRHFAQPQIVDKTKMTAANLATIFTPNIMPCNSSDLKVHLDYSSHGTAFVTHLINHLTLPKRRPLSNIEVVPKMRAVSDNTVIQQDPRKTIMF